MADVKVLQDEIDGAEDVAGLVVHLHQAQAPRLE